MSEAMYRHWTMLQLVPRAPRKISAQALFKHLEAEGYETTERTVQRDLIKLSKTFLLVSDERNKPYGWSWSKDAPIFDLPGMDVSTAITFYLSEQFLPDMLPPSIISHIKPHTQLANKTLDNVAGKKYKKWRDKIRVLSRSQQLLPPEIDDEVVNLVYQALLEDKQVKVKYETRKGEQTEYVINPKGIVLRDHVTYLVGSLWDYSDIKQLLLHRMSDAELLDTPAKKISFNLDDYIYEGKFDYLDNREEINLKIKVSNFVAKHLSETPLSKNQSLEKQDDNFSIIKATVNDTQQLKWWILGFGDGVEVLEPESLRKEMLKTINKMSKNYAT